MRRFCASPFLPATSQSGEGSPHSKAPSAPTSWCKVLFTRRPDGFAPSTPRSPQESGGEAALGVRRLCAAFGLRLPSPPHPKAANDRRTPKRLWRPRPGRRCCSRAGIAISPYRHAVVPMKAAAKPPLECGAYAPLSGFALPHGCTPKRRRIAALQGASGAHVLAEGVVHTGPAASPHRHAVVPMKAAAKPPLECGAYAPLSGFALPPRHIPKRRRIAALQSASGAHVLAQGVVHTGLAASPHRHAVVPMKAAAKPPLECGAYAPLSGFALPPRYSPKRRMIAALQGACGAHVLAEGAVHAPALRLDPIGTP